MNISPQGTIYFLRGVPLDPTYEHTIYFDGANYAAKLANQEAYFKSKVKPSSGGTVYHITEQSYQRVNSNSIRCSIPCDLLFDCNYIMFQNSSLGLEYSDRWFYAFLSNVEYVNNGCSLVTYEIDVIQTWMFDYGLGQCFVEREHSESDYVGYNTVPENLNVGEYVYIDAGKSFNVMNDPAGTGFNLVVAAAFECGELVDGFYVFLDSPGGYYGAQYSGLTLNSFAYETLEGQQGIADLLRSLNNILNAKRKEEIISIMLVPNFISNTRQLYPSVKPNEVTVEIDKYYDWTNGNNSYTGYIPKNNKLYTAPYNVLYITSSDGDSAEFKYEMFSAQNCEFEMSGVAGAPPEITLTPKGYASPLNSDAPNYNFSLFVKNFPMCSWTTDTFKAWLAQNAVRIVTDVGLTVAAGQAAKSSIEAGTEMWVARAKKSEEFSLKQVQNRERAWGDRQQDVRSLATATSVASSLLGIGAAALQPNQSHGVNAANISISNDEFGYHYYYARIKDEYAAIIDDYFTKFGYATKRVKTPNISARPYWNYVKTVGCILDDNRLPADAEDKICSIYDNGITFWKYSPTDANFAVGNYSRDNHPGVG